MDSSSSWTKFGELCVLACARARILNRDSDTPSSRTFLARRTRRFGTSASPIGRGFAAIHHHSRLEQTRRFVCVGHDTIRCENTVRRTDHLLFVRILLAVVATSPKPRTALNPVSLGVCGLCALSHGNSKSENLGRLDALQGRFHAHRITQVQPVVVTRDGM